MYLNDTCPRSTPQEPSKNLKNIESDHTVITNQGVTVSITELKREFHILNTENAISKLLPIFSLYLLNYN